MSNNNWYGDVTLENIDQVAKMMLDVLKDKKYTFVAIGMGGTDDGQGRLYTRPDVRTSLELKNGNNGSPLHTYRDEEKGQYAGFNFGDTYGVWGISTSAHDGDSNFEKNNPYVVIEWGKIYIEHRAPAGHRLYWIIATEN